MITEMKKIRIPSLDEMYEDVLAYVKEHQGEKGYIDTQDDKYDTIRTYAFNYDTEDYEENCVHGVRVIDEGDGDDLQICFEPFMRTYKVVYDEDTFTGKAEEGNAEWESVRFGDIDYIPTIFSIAESIWEYV